MRPPPPQGEVPSGARQRGDVSRIGRPPPPPLPRLPRDGRLGPTPRAGRRSRGVRSPGRSCVAQGSARRRVSSASRRSCCAPTLSFGFCLSLRLLFSLERLAEAPPHPH